MANFVFFFFLKHKDVRAHHTHTHTSNIPFWLFLYSLTRHKASLNQITASSQLPLRPRWWSVPLHRAICPIASSTSLPQLPWEWLPRQKKFKKKIRFLLAVAVATGGWLAFWLCRHYRWDSRHSSRILWALMTLLHKSSILPLYGTSGENAGPELWKGLGQGIRDFNRDCLAISRMLRKDVAKNAIEGQWRTWGMWLPDQQRCDVTWRHAQRSYAGLQ